MFARLTFIIMEQEENTLEDRKAVNEVAKVLRELDSKIKKDLGIQR